MTDEEKLFWVAYDFARHCGYTEPEAWCYAWEVLMVEANFITV